MLRAITRAASTMTPTTTSRGLVRAFSLAPSERSQSAVSKKDLGRVLIFKPATPATQQGKDTNVWRISFDKGAKWVNPLMGWTSNRNPTPALKLEFSSREQAEEYCRSNEIPYDVKLPKTRRRHVKVYADNFQYTPPEKE